MTISEQQLLKYCEHGISTNTVKHHFMKKGINESEIDGLVKELVEKKTLDQFMTPNGEMLCTVELLPIM